MGRRKSTRQDWKQNPELQARLEAQRRRKGIPKVVDRLPAAELPMLEEHLTRLGLRVTNWVAEYVAKQDDLQVAQRVQLGTFLLDHGPARGGDMRRLAPYAKRLIQWGSRRRIRQLTGVSLLAPNVLPRFLAQARDDLPLASYNECRRLLLKIASDVYPDATYEDVPPGGARSPASVTAEEVFLAQLDETSRIRDLDLRRTVQVILCVPRSCGARSTYLNGAVGDDIYLDEDKKHLRMRRGDGEPFAILARFTRPVWLLKVWAGHGPLLAEGVDDTNITGNLGRRLHRAGWSPGVPLPSVAHLVSAYRMEMGVRAVPAVKLKRLLGDVTLRSLDRLLADAPEDWGDPRGDVFGEAELPVDFVMPDIT